MGTVDGSSQQNDGPRPNPDGAHLLVFGFSSLLSCPLSLLIRHFKRSGCKAPESRGPRRTLSVRRRDAGRGKRSKQAFFKCPLLAHPAGQPLEIRCSLLLPGFSRRREHVEIGRLPVVPGLRVSLGESPAVGGAVRPDSSDVFGPDFSFPSVISRRQRPVADRGTIRHLPGGCKILSGSDSMRVNAERREFHWVAQIMLCLHLVSFLKRPGHESHNSPRR